MRPGRAADHSPLSSAAVMEELFPPSGPRRTSNGITLPFTFIYIYVCVSVCVYVYTYIHGATAPSYPGSPHYRGFTITLKTHHIR